MIPFEAYTPEQLEVIQAPLSSRIFLEGPAGVGKTTAGTARLEHLLAEGVPGDSILVLVPQRMLGLPYLKTARDPDLAPGGMVSVRTLSGLARWAVELFWPLVVEQADFGSPNTPPTFLNIETAQYHMAGIVRPLLDEGYFESVAIDRNRLYSQILDNLNKAAFVGFPHTEISSRLNQAWVEEGAQRRVYNDAQECANRFRDYCLEHNLLDFSLTMELFLQYLWPSSICQDHLVRRFPHLLIDNLEEDTPVAHDLLLEWLPQCHSALLVYDQEAGFRRFLGADPESAYRLKHACNTHLEMVETQVNSPQVDVLRTSLGWVMGYGRPSGAVELEDVLHYTFHRYYPELLDWIAETTAELVYNRGVPPGEVVVLAPYLSDALRFSLVNRLETLGIPVQSHRPSRALREEPASQTLLTLAALAHPEWAIQPTRFDTARALTGSIADLDLVRAQLLSEVLYRVRDGLPVLLPFEDVKPEMQERITYVLGDRYERLRSWLEIYQVGAREALDHFFSRLFGEVLSQPGYRFHLDLDAGKTVANLIDSARQFRRVVGEQVKSQGGEVGREYLLTVQDGVIASQYVRSWELQAQDAVLLAPAYTFLMSNRPVDYQFWLNVSSRGWWERLYQPLTHPYVLSRSWEPGKPWTDKDETRTNEQVMYRLLQGLLRRCRHGIYLGLSELDENGFDHKGPLLKVFQRVLRAANPQGQ